MIDNNTGNNIAFDAIKIGMASPEQIRAWSYGEVGESTNDSMDGEDFSDEDF